MSIGAQDIIGIPIAYVQQPVLGQVAELKRAFMSAMLALEAAPDERLSGFAAPVADSDDVVELALVLPRWQVEALAGAARRNGLTAGQAIRRLIRGFCAEHPRSDR